MACILHLGGKTFNAEQVSSSLSIRPYAMRQQVDPQPFGKYKFYPKSGLSFVASEADFDSFEQQVADVIAFVKANKAELLLLGDLARSLDESEFYFDFGLHTRMFSVYTQTDVLPAELVKLCGEIGAGIVLSQYPPPDDEEEN